MLQQFLNHIKRFDLFTPQAKILLAVSGGIDSMVMLHLIKEAGFTFAVAHCNFQLRGEDSKADEDFVKSICNQYSIPFHVIHFNTKVYAQECGLSIQMAARELRYTWFNQLCEDNKYSHLATAHHADDSLETTLLNLIRGSAFEGYLGIPVKNGSLVRPLLFALRSEVLDYATEKNIKWREDKSNLTVDYPRNFIRHEVIPKLKALNPSLDETFQKGIEKLNGDYALMLDGFAQWKKEHVTEKGMQVLISKHALANSTHGAAILWRFIKSFGFNFSQAKDIINTLQLQSGKRFLSPSHQLLNDRSSLIITPHTDQWNETIINEDDTTASIGPWNLFLNKSATIEMSTDPLAATVDAAKLSFPLTWRRWKPGDFFHPLGMSHKRKVSDFLIDLKLSMADKEAVTVIESDGNIVWVVGYRIDNRFKITTETTDVTLIRITPYFT